MIPIWLTVIAFVIIAILFWRQYATRMAVSERLGNSGLLEAEPISNPRDLPTNGWIGSWLFRAGFRKATASLIFWGSTILLGIVGLTLMYQLWSQGLFRIAAEFISAIPGGVGNVMIPFVLAAPWFLLVVIILLPTLVVRAARRKRVKSIEQDLPLLLDLLNTLAQAGIGFDSALDQILSVQNPSRPLVQELRLFQFDNLAGRSRVESLRNLMQRVHVPMFSTFISAIVQAEQTGAGIGATLKTQSAEMRSRRREKAAAAALSVPTMLVVPMVIGFLPGIFVILLGPMLFQVFGAMEQSFRGAVGQ